jgi:hypothetical protein
MAIGDKVKAADEAKAEAALNADGKLSARQLKELVGLGMALSDARDLAASGIAYDDIHEIAEQQAANLKGAEGADLTAVLAQNAAVMEKVVEKARNRRPESYNGDFPYHGISAFNPDGFAKPIPALKCEMTEAMWMVNEKTRMIEYHDTYPLEQSENGPLTKREVRLLNLLEPGEYEVENRDAERGVVRIVANLNEATGQPVKLLLACPMAWWTKEGKQKKPSITDLCCQILGIEGNVDRWLDARESSSVAA